VVLAVLLGGLCSPAQAYWLTKLLGASDELAGAGRLAGKSAAAGADATAMRSALAHRPGARGIVRQGQNIVAVDAAGRTVVLAAANGAALLGLTDDAIRWLTEFTLVIPEEQLASLHRVVHQALSIRDDAVQVLRADGRLARLRQLAGPGEQPVPGGSLTALAVEMRPGVFVRWGPQSEAELSMLLAQPLDRARSRVVSLFDESDADTLRELDAAAGASHVPVGHLPSARLLDMIRSSRGGTLHIVGHIEGSAFVVRDASGLVKQTVPLAALEEAAAASDAALVFLGCGAGLRSRTAGFLADVNARQVAAALRRAMDAESIGDALQALARFSGDLVIQETTTTAMRSHWRARQLGRAADGQGAVALEGVSLLSRARAAELSSRLVPGVPSAVSSFYLAGCVLLLLQCRSTWRRWRPTWRPSPSARQAPVRWLAVHGVRWLAFVLLMPWAALMLLAAMLAPWLLALAMFTVAWSAAIVGAAYGWIWWKSHSDQVLDQPGLVATWAIPLMSLALAVPAAALAWATAGAAALMGFDHLALNSSGSWVLQAVSALAMGPWLTRLARERRCLPAAVMAPLTNAPLRVIERLAEQVWWKRKVPHVTT